jgi:hypothetical protein
MATEAKFVLPIPNFLAYLVPLDVDVTGNITAKICEVWRHYHANRGTKIMGWGDVRYCFAMAILVITSPRLLSGDVLLFYVSFSLLFLFSFFHTFLFARFLRDALIKLYETV